MKTFFAVLILATLAVAQTPAAVAPKAPEVKPLTEAQRSQLTTLELAFSGGQDQIQKLPGYTDTLQKLQTEYSKKQEEELKKLPGYEAAVKQLQDLQTQFTKMQTDFCGTGGSLFKEPKTKEWSCVAPTPAPAPSK